MRRVGTRTKLAVFAAAAVALTSGILFPNLASAGSNGQQIQLCGMGVSGTASIFGTNQDGAQTVIPADFDWIRCRDIKGYWWVGEVTIDFTTKADGKKPSRTGSTRCVIRQDNGWRGSFVRCDIH